VSENVEAYFDRNPALQRGWSQRRDEFRHKARGSRIRVLASDVALSWGLGGTQRRFRVIADELTAWPAERGEQLWTSLASATGKVKDAQTIVLSNAGYGRGESWQWKVRETAETKSWAHLYSGDGVIASWIDEAWLEQQRELLPASAYERVILNRWVAETGDFVTRAAVAVRRARPEATAAGPRRHALLRWPRPGTGHGRDRLRHRPRRRAADRARRIAGLAGIAQATAPGRDGRPRGDRRQGTFPEAARDGRSLATGRSDPTPPKRRRFDQRVQLLL
jgi:hypothetical protein